MTHGLCLLNSIKFDLAQGKEGIIDFTSGSELLVAKAKNGHLSVVNISLSVCLSLSIRPFNMLRILRYAVYSFSDCTSPQLKMIDRSRPSTSCSSSLIHQSHDFRQSFSLPIRCQPAAPEGLCLWLWKSSKFIYVSGD